MWILQTRKGKRSTQAGLKIAVDMIDEGLISEEEAILRLDPTNLDELLHPTLDSHHSIEDVLVHGLPASPGAAVGKIVFQSQDAEALKAKGEDVILVRTETSPEDIHGMVASVGIVTTKGGMTSHAAVVARGMGKPCVVGCTDLEVNYTQQILKIDKQITKRFFYFVKKYFVCHPPKSLIFLAKLDLNLKGLLLVFYQQSIFRFCWSLALPPPLLLI